MRAWRAERLATTRARIASTLPSADLAIPLSRPDNAPRAASMASTVSDLPCRRRSWRFGRSASITFTASSAQVPGQARRRRRRCPRHRRRSARRSRPAIRAVPDNPPLVVGERLDTQQRRRCASSAAATCMIQVSVDTTRHRARALYDGHRHPFSLQVVEGWHARPGKETVSDHAVAAARSVTLRNGA